MENLMFKNSEKLSSSLSVAYLDAPHKDDVKPNFSFIYDEYIFSFSRKVFINSDTKTIRVEQKLITDVNDKKTFEKVKQQIL